jgi:hypothetical protein
MKMINLNSYFDEMWDAQQVAMREGGFTAAFPVYYRYVYALLDPIFTFEKDVIEAIAKQVGRKETGFLFGIAKSCAQSAISDNNAVRTRYGLMALMLENGHEDYRESLMRLSLLDNSARKLNCDFHETWNLLKNKCPGYIYKYIDAYFKRGGVSISEMGGYFESTDTDGSFIYKRNW